MVCKFFDEKSRVTTSHIGAEIIYDNQNLANELHKPITREFQRRKAYLFDRDGIWDVNLADLHLICR